jgi:ABC-type Co2+ transport system permease subunit
VLLAFIPTQVPIGIIEGIITGALAYAIAKKRKDLLYIKVI